MNPVTIAFPSFGGPAIALPTQALPNVLTTAQFGLKLIEHFGRSGARPVEITARTIPAVLAACPFRHDLCKYARINVMVNVDYEKAVLRRREKMGVDGPWEAAERKNGLEPVNGTPFLIHPTKGILYLRCLHPKSHGYEYRSLDGRTVYDTDEVHRYMSKSRNRQGLDEKDEVRERDYTLTNIIAATIDKAAYMIVHSIS